MFLDLIAKRRSIRKYQRREIAPETLEALVEAALNAPSSRGFNPWELVVATDKNLLSKLSRAKEHGSSFLAGAAAGVVVCADSSKSDVWVEDAAIVSVFIQLAAASLGLGSCWIQIRERMHDAAETAEDYVRKVLGIPSFLKVESIVALGYPDEEKPPRSRESLPYEKVHAGSYGHPFPMGKHPKPSGKPL